MPLAHYLIPPLSIILPHYIKEELLHCLLYNASKLLWSCSEEWPRSFCNSCVCVVVWNLRHQFQACLVLRVGTIDFLLKSYCSHFSSYSCFPHIQAICQVTMTGAGTCKQDICIQEIALLRCAFPQAVTMREPKYGYISAEGGNWKIACADNNTLAHMHTGTSATTHKHIHIKQGVAPSRALNIRTLKWNIRTNDCRLLFFFAVVCAPCSNRLTRGAAVWGVMMEFSQTDKGLFK